MAQLLHNLGRGMTACGRTLGPLSTFVIAGCFLGPPVEVEPAKENRPPYIDRDGVLPQNEIVFADSSVNPRLSLEAIFDPDGEETLYYVWYSPARSEILESNRIPLISGASEQFGDLFSQYEAVSYTVNPCVVDLRGRQSETIWFYLTDRPWQRIGSSGVEPEEGAFLTSWVWVIDLSLVACN